MLPRLAKTLPLLLLGAACYGKKADSVEGPMSSTGLPIPDGGPLPDGATAPDANPAATDGGGGDGRAGDASADRGPSPQVMAYTQFLDEQWKAWSARWVTCFNTPPEALAPGRSPLYDEAPDQHAYSLEHGLVVLDQTKARACLDALKTVSCEGLAGDSFRSACAQALVGHVASGGFCASPDDCQNATDLCLQKEMHGCFSRCTAQPAPVAVGELCGDRLCVAGAACSLTAGGVETRCHALGTEGMSCPDRLSCAAGTWCQPAAPAADPGTCRTLQVGLACQGSWQCPPAYACVIPGGAASGSCQAGHKKGEACALHGKDLSIGPFSDCANGLSCYPDAASQYKCGVGRELGEGCGELDVGGMNPLTIPCRVGSCRADGAGKRTCQADQKAGAACSSDLPCEPGLGCIAGKCADPVVALGERCSNDGTYVCPWGARCAPLAVSPTQGTCVALKRIGEPCADPDDCEAGSSCTGGTCTACK
jgi:hypothetical protein